MPTVALTVWGSRVSPVFESAAWIRVLQTAGTRVVRQTELYLPPEPMSRIAMLREHDVRVLICGAISGLQASIIRAAEIELIPFVAGDVEEILVAYVQGKLGSERFAMPGCSGRHRRRRRRGRGNKG
ncbi:NifB/NifX family molybdenum-iron cluster-binding protein [Desulfovermiculus halophilus]|uniref:NifB/NifX family molybdenum-iron cluster-binding protein n=1 Tax=Desulfovermiculus halophilus TaxID=339722 RepID=UPI0004849A46|nr:NifB/NifX family molybdenum-iron cluster-binding protein [Desulfovermiculus halophilus]